MIRMRKFTFLLLNLLVLLHCVRFRECMSRFDDDYNEFDTNLADVDIQRNVKPISTPNKSGGSSFDFDNNDQYKDSFRDADFRRESFKYDSYRNDPYKEDMFRRDPFKGDYFGKPDPTKTDSFRTDELKSDFKKDFKYDFKDDFIRTDAFTTDVPKSDQLNKPMDKLPTTTEINSSRPVMSMNVRKKQSKYDHFNRSDSLIDEYNANFDDESRISDYESRDHDSWSEQNRNYETPRRDSVSEKLVLDYRQPTPRTPFRVPMIPVPTFYPPFLPAPFLPPPPLLPQPINRPQQQSNQQQSNRPSRPQANNQPQQNVQSLAPGWVYPYPMLPVMPHSLPNAMPNSMPNQGGSNGGNMNGNLQLQHALQNMMNRNSFLGFVDPLIIVAIIAIPVIGILGFSSVVMPFIPVIIYVLNIFFPVSAASGRRRRKKRSISLDDLCIRLIDNLNENDYSLDLLRKNSNHHLLYDERKLNELETYLRRFYRSICI